ncbi:MAG TPA: DinB family protein [Chthonomonadaceae bacterium]|nr:DinB family protein [Chthonomonadaceae bacterium]
MAGAGSDSLAVVFDGWNGYNTSIVRAIEPLTADQLAFRPFEGQNSVGEIARHIALGRIGWFLRMDAPQSFELAADIPEWTTDRDGNRHIVESAIPITQSAGDLAAWLNTSWRMVEATLNAWTVGDLTETYRHTYWGKAYEVSRQWTLWRIMAHDIHHGGQLTILLGMQGIEALELIALGGHIIEPPLASV